ncbi:MAG: hypothetical protein ABW168_05705 [Sedimenticola sp.]
MATSNAIPEEALYTVSPTNTGQEYMFTDATSAARRFLQLDGVTRPSVVKTVSYGEGEKASTVAHTTVIRKGDHSKYGQSVGSGDQAFKEAFDQLLADRERVEEEISEIFEANDPVDELSVTNALSSNKAAIILDALERVSQLEQQFNAAIGNYSQEEDLPGSDMKIDSIKERYGNRVESVRDDLRSCLCDCIAEETGMNIWPANVGSEYSGEFVKEDGEFHYQQIAENTLIGHPREAFGNPDESLLGLNTTIGYFPEQQSADQEEKEMDKTLAKVKIITKGKDRDRDRGKDNGR